MCDVDSVWVIGPPLDPKEGDYYWIMTGSNSGPYMAYTTKGNHFCSGPSLLIQKWITHHIKIRKPAPPVPKVDMRETIRLCTAATDSFKRCINYSEAPPGRQCPLCSFIEKKSTDIGVVWVCGYSSQGENDDSV